MKDEIYYNELLEIAIENTDLSPLTKSIAPKILSVEVRGQVVGIYRDDLIKGKIF